MAVDKTPKRNNDRTDSGCSCNPGGASNRDGRTKQTKRKSNDEPNAPNRRDRVNSTEAGPSSQQDNRPRGRKRKNEDEVEANRKNSDPNEPGPSTQESTRQRGKKRNKQDDEERQRETTPQQSMAWLIQSRGSRKSSPGGGRRSSSLRRTLNRTIGGSSPEQSIAEPYESVVMQVEPRNDPMRKGQKQEFETKYMQLDLLCGGGCGNVFCGYRKADCLQVAIKHIPKKFSLGKHPDEDRRLIPMEVAVMLKMQNETPPSTQKATPVFLLDWYNLPKELILVMERPVPAVDMFDYLESKGGTLKEEEAKILMRQLVLTAVDMEGHEIFHRDIKLENILIETGARFPRARLIDFGLSCFTKKNSCYRVFRGTPNYIPPEWFGRNCYKAGPTTVWQLGAVLYEALHQCGEFTTARFVTDELTISPALSKNCQDLLYACMNMFPERRPELRELPNHPWLR